jgi:4-alpha-glucanotransferase
VSVPSLGRRASGILLHPTCLPGPHGSGDLGREARAFVDFLAGAGQSWWQMLPIGPPGYGESPYSSQSAFAGSPMLVSLEELADEGLLDRHALELEAPLAPDRIDYHAMEAHRLKHLRAAFSVFQARAEAEPAFREFCKANAAWLDDYALFRAIKLAHRGAVQWTRWEPGFRRRDPDVLNHARKEFAHSIAFEKFLQYEFDKQWQSLRAYATQRGVGLIGDIPIFVAHDSADVWQAPEGFFLGEDGEPTVIAGVPPDYFSATGQRWGNPLYRWKRMRKSGYGWWIERLKMTLSRFDAIRIDHFIGFQRYWRIPASEPTAVGGRWMKGPGAHFFRTVKKALGTLPLIAEDLGAVTPAVFALRDRFGLPGVKILQFAFGTDPYAYTFLPHNYPRRAVVYTGTHDNDTTAGWFHDKGGGWSTRSPEQTEVERQTTLRYLGTRGEEIHWEMIQAALASVANIAILPLQDVLGLGTEARMNRPGNATGNWVWRFKADMLTAAQADRLSLLTRTYERNPENRER